MRTIACWILVTTSLLPLGADEVPVTTKTSYLDILERFTERSQSLKSWTANYQQVRMASLLKDPIQSLGELHVLQPDRVRWDQTVPVESVMTVNDRDVLVYTPAKNSARTYKMSKQFSPQHLFMPGPEMLKRFKKYFDGEVTEVTKDEVTVRLEPTRKRLKKVVHAITIRISRSSWLMNMLKVERSEEDYLKVVLTNYKLENHLTPPFFEFLPPVGTEIQKIKEAEDLFTDIVGD